MLQYRCTIAALHRFCKKSRYSGYLVGIAKSVHFFKSEAHEETQFQFKSPDGRDSYL